MGCGIGCSSYDKTMSSGSELGTAMVDMTTTRVFSFPILSDLTRTRIQMHTL